MPSAPVPTFPVVLIRDLADGQELDQVLLVRVAAARTTRDDEPYLRLSLGDRSGRLTAIVRDGAAAVRELCALGRPVHVRGRYEVHARFGPQLALRSVAEPEPGSFEMSELLDGPWRPPDAMEDEIRELVATVQQPHLRAVLDRLLGPRTETWDRYRRAPAAKLYHHSYVHGLLEHCLTVAQGVSALASTFPGIDRDVAVTGALLHDLGKLEAYTADPQAIDLTDAGRLQGEIALGYYRVRRAIEDLPGFPTQTAQALLHVILSHHGSLEHGSPVVPCTREAWLVHLVDNLGGKLGSFDRVEKALSPGSAWAPFDRGIGASAYFGAGAEPERRAA
jgi:3'-5' exoribonuclease